MWYIHNTCYIYIYIYHTHTQQKKTQQTTHIHPLNTNHHSPPTTQKMDIWTSRWTPSWVVRQDPPPTAPRSPQISTRLEVGRKPYPSYLYTGKTIHPGRFTTAGTWTIFICGFGNLVQMIFLFNSVIFGFQPFIFQGVFHRIHGTGIFSD